MLSPLLLKTILLVNGIVSVTSYVVPEAVVSVNNDRGFKVSIPDEAGVELFAFHGNLNKHLAKPTAGEFSHDVTRAENGSWTFEERNVRLKAGDKLYYWLYVVYAGRGHIRDGQVWTYPQTQPTVGKISAQCNPTPTTASGTKAPGTICSGDLIFNDDFDTFDLLNWGHEITMSGGGNWEFQVYTNNRSNSFVQDGNLHLRPSLTSDQYGEAFLSSGTLNLDGGAPADACTNPSFYGCERAGNGVNILNPAKSARVRTIDSFAFKYGRIEIRAKMPVGDWLWAALWMMPRYNKYGVWPASGEIDISEVRCNRNYAENGKNIGIDQTGSTLHFGPFWPYNGYERAHYDRNVDGGLDGDWHTYELLWTETSMRFSLDGVEMGTVAPPGGGFWELGGFGPAAPGIENPWRHGDFMAPFDQEYYIILNLAVGGTNGYFPDSAVNSPAPKPWLNNSPQAFLDFWNGRNEWLPTWNLDVNDGASASMQVDYVKVWAI